MNLNVQITREIIIEQVITNDGHSYEKTTIEKWLRTNMKSQVT